MGMFTSFLTVIGKKKNKEFSLSLYFVEDKYTVQTRDQSLLVVSLAGKLHVDHI